MKKNIKYFICLFFIMSSIASAKENFFEEAKKLYENKKYEDSKFLFQRNIVFNPKDAESYLYLAKIFKVNGNDEEEEVNLKNVLLINPQNDEAIYMLTLLKIKQSDYDKAKDLLSKFLLVCNTFCSKDKEIEEKLLKIIPENEKNNN